MRRQEPWQKAAARAAARGGARRTAVWPQRVGGGAFLLGRFSPMPPPRVELSLQATCRRYPPLGSRRPWPPESSTSPTVPPKARDGFIIPYRNLLCAAPPMGARGARVLARASKVPHLKRASAIALEPGHEKRFTLPVPTKHRGTGPSASGARRRSYTRGSEVGDRCRPSL